jgi:hypothetical protein
VSAANEVAEMNALYGTNIVTSAATCTLAVIDGSKVVLYLDCSLGTGLLALHTTDTTVGAGLTCYCALIMAGALYYYANGILYEMNDVVRTSLLTKTATDTLLGVDLCDALFLINSDSISGTNVHTVTVAKAGIGALAVARIVDISSKTGVNTVVNELSLLGLARAVAGYVSNLFNNVTCGKSHDLTDLFSNTVTAGNTEAGVVALTLTESLCISVTARVTASTAVCTGEAVTNGNNLFVFLNCKEGSSNGKNYRTNEGYNCKYD